MSGALTSDHPSEESSVGSYSLFQTRWWLDAVSPGAYSVESLEVNGQVEGRWPYVWRNRFGLRIATQPPLTQTLGPWIRQRNGKVDSSLSRQHELIGSLIQQLPSCDLFMQNVDPTITNPLPFYWNGFDVSVRCTYRVSLETDVSRIWTAFSDRCRNSIRKAEKIVTVREDLTIADLHDAVSKSWSRQGMEMPHSLALLKRIDTACSEQKAHRILIAEDAAGRRHAGLLIVHDGRTAYYLLGGGDPDLRESGANSLLLWHAIRSCVGTSKVFDFEGSMHQGIERFFRSFGAVQTPYLHVRRISRRMRAFAGIRDILVALTGHPGRWFY